MFRLFRSRTTSKPRRATLSVEALEARAVPAVFNVNSTADLLNPPAGTVTLRSAISAANATPGGNTINLTVPGTYKITLPGANEDANKTGDFDILAGGGNLTIANTSGGSVTVDGNNLDRIFDINPTFDPNHPANTPAFKVTLQGLVLQHGIAGAQGGNIVGGGAIQDTGDASLELDGCAVLNNVASGAGGGILMQNTVNTPWTLTLNGSTVTDNRAGDAGGGIDTIGQGHVIINNSELTGNVCVNQGAAVWLDVINNVSATLALSNSLVNRNMAFNGATGALGVAGNGAVTITSTTVRDNYSGTTGGGFGDENLTANVTLVNDQFISNTALTNGGGVQAGGAGTTTTISGCLFADNTAGGLGGGLDLTGGTTTITDTRFTENTAESGGGIEESGTTLTLTACEVDNNRAVGNPTGGNGGGLDIAGGNAVTINNSLFLNNAAINAPVGNGGAIDHASGTLTINSSEFLGNYATDLGGAVNSFVLMPVTITGSTFANNQAGSLGGAVYLNTPGTSMNPPTTSLTNDTFTGNTAGVNGGAVADNGGETLSFLNDTINGNHAGQMGGGVFLQTNMSTYMFENTIVALNTAASDPDILATTGAMDHGGNFIGNFTGALGLNPFSLTGNPKLGPLEDNGGPAVGLTGFGQVLLTEALLPGSTAIGNGVSPGAATTDARGFPRPGNGHTNLSIGAYEPQYAANASANTVFVENVYEVLLNRVADPGAAGWVAFLNQGGSTITVIQDIEASPEYRGDMVQNIFEHFLHRAANPQEQQSFVGLLGSFTVEQVEAFVVGSQEYFALHGSTNEGFLDALYADTLNRTPGMDELNAWQQVLGSQTRTQVAAAVFGSTEYLSDLVTGDYQNLLGRQPDADGLSGFVASLQGKNTDQTVLAEILGSGEAFGNRTT